jgi:L-rhamnose-H+ transport protein
MVELLSSGALLAMIGGVMNGSFSVPMKFTEHWTWANTWLIYSVVGMVLIPIGLAVFSVPNLLATYQASSAEALALTALFGFGWGVGSTLFGLGISRLGIALGFSIILGLTAALGALIPLLVLTPHYLGTARGTAILLGLAIVLVGIALCGRAGGLKDAEPSSPHGSVTTEGAGHSKFSRYRAGLLICVASGILSSMLNLGLAFGAPIADAAVRTGASATGAQNAVWALAVGAGSVVNIGYTFFLLFRDDSWRAYRAAGSAKNWIASATMGVLWMFGIVVYGAGASSLGDLGTIIGWPLFMATVIVTSNMWGFATGEWRHARPAAVAYNIAGVIVLIAAILVISRAGLL